MLSWVVKVAPQLPEPPPRKIEVQKEEKAPTATATATTPGPKKVTFKDDCNTGATKADKSKQEAQPEEGNGPGSQSGVLGWISSALPQPAGSPKLSRTNSTTSKDENTTTSLPVVELTRVKPSQSEQMTAPLNEYLKFLTVKDNPEDKKGMIAWIAQGLEKVVPQPELKRKEPPPQPAEQPTEVCQNAAPPVAVPETTAKDTEREEKPETKAHPPRMIDWIKQGIEKVVPQPEFHVRSNTDAKEKTEPCASTGAKEAEPPSAPKPATATEKSSKEAEQQPKMMSWIVTGIGRMLPQPVHKQDSVRDEVQKRGTGGEPL